MVREYYKDSTFRWEICFNAYIMTKEKLIETIKRILNTDTDLNFLVQLYEKDLETMIACIRDRVELR